MTDLRAHREERRHLTDRLIVEYAGSLPPGQVLATVLRADRLLSPFEPDQPGRFAMFESVARHWLAERGARANNPRVQPSSMS